MVPWSNNNNCKQCSSGQICDFGWEMLVTSYLLGYAFGIVSCAWHPFVISSLIDRHEMVPSTLIWWMYLVLSIVDIGVTMSSHDRMPKVLPQGNWGNLHNRFQRWAFFCAAGVGACRDTTDKQVSKHIDAIPRLLSVFIFITSQE